jgi:DNA uptake protein ComE-like DNA-binding protein
MLLPGVGAKGADTILEMREAKGDLELEDLSHVPYLLNLIGLSPF